jgi:hypothetical protein
MEVLKDQKKSKLLEVIEPSFVKEICVLDLNLKVLVLGFLR